MTADLRLRTAVACGVVGLGLMLGGPFVARPRVVVGFLLAIVCAWIAAVIVRDARKAELLAGILLLSGTLSAVLNPMDLLRAKEALVAWVVAWLLWMGARRTPGCGRRAAFSVVWATAVMLAVLAVFEALVVDTSRVGGIFENPNVLAAILVPLIPLWFKRPVGMKPGAVIGGVVVLAALGGGLVATGSRAAVLAVLAGAVLVIPKGGARRVVAVLSVAVGTMLFAWRMLTVADPLAWHRLAIWRAVTELWRTYPIFGVGLGALPTASGVVRIPHPGELALHQRIISYAESTFLAIPVQLGIVGVLIAGLGVWFWLQSHPGRKLVRPRPGRGALGAIVVFAAFHDVTTVEPVLWWWAVVIGLLESEWWCDPPGAGHGSSARWLAAVSIGGLIIWGLVNPAVADAHWQSSDRSTTAVEKALRLEPWAARPAMERDLALLRSPTWEWRDAAECLAWSRHLVRVNPGAARTWAVASRCRRRSLQEVGGWEPDLEAARFGLRRACELEPRLPWYWLEWAELEAQWGEPAAALALAHSTVGAEPNYVVGWALIGELELRLGRVDRATEALAAARAAAARGRGRHLTSYERALMADPAGRLRRLERLLQ